MTATAPKMTERELQTAIIDMAHTFGWKVAAFRPAMTQHGWRTPVQADGKGWPDLILVHAAGRKVLFREVKVGKGRLTTEQEQWGAFLERAGEDWSVWRDTDWPDQIIVELSLGKARVTPR